MKAIRVLFVCTGNVARSPMAAEIFLELVGRDAPYAARAVGTASWAVRRLTTRDLAGADVVLNAVPMFLEEGEEVRLEAHGRYKPLRRAAVPRSSPGRCIA